MVKVYLADANSEERSALRLLLNDLKMEVIAESSNWLNTLANFPETCPEILLIDRDLLPPEALIAVMKLRALCPKTFFIILIANQRALSREELLSGGVDLVVSKLETPERIAEHLRTAAEGIQPHPSNRDYVYSGTGK